MQNKTKKQLSLRRFNILIARWVGVLVGGAIILAVIEYTRPVNDLGDGIAVGVMANLYGYFAFYAPLVVSCIAMRYSLKYKKHDPRYFKSAVIWAVGSLVVMAGIAGTLSIEGAYRHYQAEQRTQSLMPPPPKYPEYCRRYSAVHTSISHKQSALNIQADDYANIKSAIDTLSGELTALDNRLSKATYCKDQMPSQNDLKTLESAEGEEATLSKEYNSLKPTVQLLHDWKDVASLYLRESHKDWQSVQYYYDEEEGRVQGYKLTVTCTKQGDLTMCSDVSWVRDGTSTDKLTTRELLDMVEAELAQKDKELQDVSGI